MPLSIMVCGVAAACHSYHDAAVYGAGIKGIHSILCKKWNFLHSTDSHNFLTRKELLQ